MGEDRRPRQAWSDDEKHAAQDAVALLTADDDTPLESALAILGLPKTTFYRWRKAEDEGYKQAWNEHKRAAAGLYGSVGMLSTLAARIKLEWLLNTPDGLTELKKTPLKDFAIPSGIYAQRSMELAGDGISALAAIGGAVVERILERTRSAPMEGAAVVDAKFDVLG